jgi:hypothetical protein
MNINCLINTQGPSSRSINMQRRAHHRDSDDHVAADSDPMQSSDHESSDVSEHPKRIVKMTERAKYVYCIFNRLAD